MGRVTWRRNLAVLVLVTMAVASCGDDDQADDAGAPTETTLVPTTASPTTEPVPTTASPTTAVPTTEPEVEGGPSALSIAAREDPDPTVAASVAGDATSGFGIDLFEAVVADSGPGSNVVVSPASVAIALAMLEPGATGDAQTQLRALLRIDDPAEFHASMNALEQSLESRVAEAINAGDDPGELTVRIANAAYLQQGFPFEQQYLDAIGSHYGPVLNAVDFSTDPDAVAHEINRFVSETTNDRIPELVPDGAISDDTVLALVNALYLNASWQQVFPPADTADAPFTLDDGSETTVTMMHGSSDASGRGEGWVAATKNYVGGLAVEFVLPDPGRSAEIRADLTAVLADYHEHASSGSDLAVPRFETRFHAELSPALQSLGLTAPYLAGHLLGIADEPRLVIDQAIHETFVAMDEEGTEAAAATIVLIFPTSAPALPPVAVILDRPFLFRIFDRETGATLFLGQVLNPDA
jgi:serpin B